MTKRNEAIEEKAFALLPEFIRYWMANANTFMRSRPDESVKAYLSRLAFDQAEAFVNEREKRLGKYEEETEE